MIPSCIICKKQIKPLYEGEHTPEYATTFHTSGHDGSGLFDPMDGSFLQINICDNCLAAAAEQDLVLVGQSSVPLMNRLSVDFGVDECGEEFVEFGFMLPDGCYAVIEDGTYGQLQALRIYKEECHDD